MPQVQKHTMNFSTTPPARCWSSSAPRRRSPRANNSAPLTWVGAERAVTPTAPSPPHRRPDHPPPGFRGSAVRPDRLPRKAASDHHREEHNSTRPS
jgi:hypothetical protein